MPLYYCPKKDFRIENIEKITKERNKQNWEKIIDVIRKSTPGVTWNLYFYDVQIMCKPLAFQRGVIHSLTILQHKDIGVWKLA